MKEHKTACAVLMLAVAGFIFGTQKMQGVVSLAEDAAEAAETEAGAATLQRRVFEANLISLTDSSADLRERAAEWKPEFERFTTPQEAEQRVGELVRQEGVFLLSQRYEVLKRPAGSFIGRVLKCDLVVEDDYVKTLNWLGSLEERIPVGRSTECRLVRGDRGNDINLKLSFEVPLLDLDRK